MKNNNSFSSVIKVFHSTEHFNLILMFAKVSNTLRRFSFLLPKEKAQSGLKEKWTIDENIYD